MKDTLILTLTAALMLALMLGGQALRGDFTQETGMYAANGPARELAAVEKDGRALININRADAETLCLIDGVGEVLSQRIVEYREENGLFSSVDELLEVRGIGEATLEDIRPRLVCAP